MSHASRRSKDEQREELTAAIAEGVARGLRQVRPELEVTFGGLSEKLAADLAKAMAAAVRTAASTARVNVR